MEGTPTPDIFKLWSAIFAVGSAVRRRVWTELLGGRPIYPNLFVWLVGPPGTGKTEAIVPMSLHLRKSKTARLAPNDVSKQSLLDALKGCGDVLILGPNAVPVEYHYMAIVVRELSNFMSAYDGALTGILTDLFDNPPENDELKRTTKSAGPIIRPSVSMIAGTATKNLGSTVKETWGQGFMSRMILVYSAEQQMVQFFNEDLAERQEWDDGLVRQLSRIGSLKGRMRWTPEAVAAFQAWQAKGYAPVPTHAKLLEYTARRFLHVSKLAMISALSDERVRIEEGDFLRGLRWLEHAESAMPEIFKEMVVHEDGEILRELHMHLWAMWSAQPKDAKRPFPSVVLWSFLKDKVAARLIPGLIESGLNSGLWARMAGTSGSDAKYKPLPNFGQIKSD